jgi:hypothetical protein
MLLDIPCKWNQKKARIAITTPDKIDFKISKKRSEWSYIDKEASSARGYSNSKHIYSLEHPIYKANNRSKGRIDFNTIIAEDFNALLLTVER